MHYFQHSIVFRTETQKKEEKNRTPKGIECGKTSGRWWFSLV